VKLLADTGALLALLVRNDRYHSVAVEFVRTHPHARFLLTNLILSELVTRVRARTSAGQAAAAGRSLLEGRRYEVLFVDAPLISSALARMEQFADKRLSLTDCVSFELMDRIGIDQAFTFDRDFRDCGYTILP
jgi:predicted nucleic acid-binding protein